MATKKKSARRAPARKVTPTVTMKPRAGKAAKGVEIDPSVELEAVLAPEKRERRPYSTRYPIADERFRDLKEKAEKAKLPKGEVEAKSDAGSGKEDAAEELEALAPAIGTALAEAPVAAGNFAGIDATGWLPPDCTMATGPEHVLLSVNSSVAIHMKAGGPALIQRTLTQWFGALAQDLTVFDPKALYDQHAGRWVLLAVAFRTNPNRSVFLLSVSTSPNPMGTWRNYSFDAMVDGSTATSNWADFPALGVDNQAIYITANMFAFQGGFRHSKIRVIPKAGPYSGSAAPFFDFVKMKNPDDTLAFTIQPCHTFGAPQVEYLVNSLFPGGSSLTIWRVDNPATSPVLTRSSVAVAPYSLPPNADQKGGGPPLNTGDVRLLHAVFRGDSIWTALTTARSWSGSGNRAAIHWFQVRAASSTLVQEGVYGNRSFHYFYPAGCPDNQGNLTVVFSRCGPSEFGSIRYTGRRSTDALGQLQGSKLLKKGLAHYQGLDSGGRNRWGDYNGVAADPANPRLIWFYSEYASAVDTWGTWVGRAFF
ncbi:MAG: hypothetical protein R2762_19810 [Bryobacteraceae bacterium]